MQGVTVLCVLSHGKENKMQVGRSFCLIKHGQVP